MNKKKIEIFCFELSDCIVTYLKNVLTGFSSKSVGLKL